MTVQFMSAPNIKTAVTKLADVLPDAPMEIIRGAKKLGAAKDKIAPATRGGLLNTVDNGLKDLGAAGGVGITALGGAINKVAGPNKIGRGLKRIGVGRVIDPDKARGTGAILAGVASIPAYMGVNALAHKAQEGPSLSKLYGVDPEEFN